MKQFFKFLTASCLGTLLALLVLVGILTIIAVSSQPKHTISSNSILKLDLDQMIPEKTDNVQESPYTFTTTKFLGLEEISRLIIKAKDDSRIKGILIQSQFPMTGPSTSLSLRNALEEFASTDKLIWAYGDFFSQSGYYLASTADSIFLNPNGYIELRGVAMMVPFYKKLMDKLGIKWNIFYAGKYKGATEPYRENQMSDENRYQTKEFLADLSSILIKKIAESRGKEYSEIESILSNYSSTNSKAAIEYGLADSLVYWGEFESLLKNNLGIDENKSVSYVDLNKYSKVTSTRKSSKASEKIAIVYAEGDIVYKNKENGVIGHDRYAEIFRKIRKRDDIKAVVLRINSPGGSGFASDLIWKEIMDIKNSGKKVVTSFGDYGASGGYYIAAPSDKIVAQPTTLTGSIGVYLMIPEISELLNDRIGIQFDTVKSHPYSVTMNPIIPLNSKEREILEKWTVDLYDNFLNRVADGRNMTPDQVDIVAQGRVWTGEDAIEVGLVDQLGGLQDAIDLAAELAELEDYKLREYPIIKENLYKEFISSLIEEQQSKMDIMPKEFKQYQKLIQLLNNVTSQEGPQARLPYFFQSN